MNKIFIACGLLGVLVSAWGQEATAPEQQVQGLDIRAERALIAKERQLSQDQHKAALAACYQKIAVNACKEEALQIKLQQDNVLRRRELVLNEAERRENSVKAQKSADDKQSLDKQNQEAERRREAQELHLDKLQSNLEKKEERLKKEMDIAANREARAKQLEEVLERQRAHEAKVKEASKAQEAYQRKLQEAQQHRAQVEKDRANRKPSVEPLPPRSDTQP